MDITTIPLIATVFGTLAIDLIVDASKDYLKDKIKAVYEGIEELGDPEQVELAYQDAMEQAYSVCLELLLQNIQSHGLTEDELQEYRSSLERFIKDSGVAEELLKAVQEPSRTDLPSPALLRERWNAVGGLELPSDTLWNTVAMAFRRQAIKREILSPALREVLNAQNLQRITELMAHQGGVKIQVHREEYAKRMRTKFAPVDLANLMPATADDPGPIVVRDLFVPQNVRENPPREEIPKDLAERLQRGGHQEEHEGDHEDLDEQQLSKLRTVYASQTPEPVLDVISAQGGRLVVITGEPGSGKSTLMRYLLTGILVPPIDRESGSPLSWTLPFKNAFPLLIELREFYALRRDGEFDNFLEYVAYMGKTDQWSLDDHTVNQYLDNEPSLVMFDGLDEIFDSGDRERVMHEIVGFSQRYPNVRIIVTSRPVGYKENILRDGGFTHFGIQDLDDEQIESFISGWFALTFPQQPTHAEQRMKRVLDSIKQSKSIRLLAGNPMLLTIMALLAREQELPRERAKFYEKAVEVLCHHWDANRHLNLGEDRYLSADDKKTLLRRIAMHMQTGDGGLKGNFIHEDDLMEQIQAYLMEEEWQPNAAEARRAARRMIDQLRERNYILCLRGARLYGFVHRTFLEYLTAAEYVRRFDKQPHQMTIEELIDLYDQHCNDDEWREVLRLICGQIDAQVVGRIVTHLAHRPNANYQDERPELILAIWCLSEVRNVSRLDQVGDVLLAAIVSYFQGEYFEGSPDHFSSLIDAAKALGAQWPGQRDIPYKNAPLPLVAFWKHLYWAHFVAAVLKERSAVAELLGSTEWGIREGASRALVETWPDETTRKLLTECTVQGEDEGPRSTALRMLAKTWPDEKTRQLLTDRAVQDLDGRPRTVALEALGQYWPNEITRILLTERALKDEYPGPRTAALEALSINWPDEITRSLLTERAVQDADEAPRREALRALTENWPDAKTRKLLSKFAPVDGAAASLLGGFHSRFGRILFTRDLDGVVPYLDPTQPLSRDHIIFAADSAGVPADMIDEQIRSLSTHLGWDITKGAGNRVRQVDPNVRRPVRTPQS